MFFVNLFGCLKCWVDTTLVAKLCPMTSLITWPLILGKLITGSDLNRAEAAWALDEIMTGNTEPGVIETFMVSLRRKGEGVEELSGLVDAMLTNSLKLETGPDAVDIVGTGGDLLGTVNISSMASVLTAATGVPVLKHGSRSASGKTGSAEMLEALGVRLDLTPTQVTQVFQNSGISFFFAQVFHPAMRYVAPIRKLLAIPTTFNFLGPLANPAQPIATSLGVANRSIAPLMASELAARGRTALVFRGNDGLDELSTTSNNEIWQVSGGVVSPSELNPVKLGLAKAQTSQLVGGNAVENAQVARDVFAGNTSGNLGAVRDIVLLNAAGGVVSYEMAKDSSKADVDMATRFEDALHKVTQALDSGAAEAKLGEWISASASA
jgi:anthranilate phosphoribosyltransferase